LLILKYVSEKKDHFKDILKIIKKSKKKVCYVTLNKSCGFLIEAFKKEKIDLNKSYFVDCISADIKVPKKVEKCDFISAPYELDYIGDSIKKAIDNGCNLVIFDSLSNLLIYGQAIPSGAGILIELINSFLPELEKRKGDAIFICKSKDKGNLLIEETLEIFNKVVGG